MLRRTVLTFQNKLPTMSSKYSSRAGYPFIVNDTKWDIVVFKERGNFFNKQVIKPGEALQYGFGETGALPYSIHAVIGGEESMPSIYDSFKSFVQYAAPPVNFIGSFLISVAGRFNGTTLAPLVNSSTAGIDLAAVGSSVTKGAAVTRPAKALVNELSMYMQNHPPHFHVVRPDVFPGERYIAIRGGVDSSLQIQDIQRQDFERMKVEVVKPPIH